jgi:hypothetical protein
LYESNSPSAKNLIHALRDIGYSLETAIADIVDNSISANASEINIYINFNFDNSYIAIIDNGTGMNEVSLKNAMKIGSCNPINVRSTNDLGRFGLGLKTASFSQASKLTVATKENNNTYARCWDLDYISKTEEWQLEILNNKLNKISELHKLSQNGTLVLWEKLDKLIETNHKRKTEDIFWEKIDSAREYLGLVFHRYLTGETGLKKISININDDPITPFNPFEGAGKHFPEEQIGNIKIQAYQLPHHSKVSTEQYKRLEGREGYLKAQGFYVYRNARLLIHGTWFRLAKQLESTKLARVKIDLPNSEDFSWSIDVKKSQATPPDTIKAELKRTIDRIMSSSSKVYKKRGSIISKKDYVPVWSEYHNHNEKSYRLNYENPTISALLSELNVEIRKKVKDIFSIIESTLPIDSIFADLSTEPENVKQNNITYEQLSIHAENYWKLLSNMGNTAESISIKLKQTEPFSKFEEFCNSFIENKLKENTNGNN